MTTIHDLAGAYSVDALDEAERAEFEAHLVDCPDCRDEVAANREVLGALAAAQPALPPPGLEDGVLAAAVAAGRSAASDASGTRGPVGGGTDRTAGPVRQPAPRRAVWRGLAAAAVVVGVFAGGAVVGRQTAPPAAETIVAAPLDDALAVAAAGDAQVLPVEVMGSPSRVLVSSEMGKAVFVAADLPTPAKGQCYQVWRVGPDGAKSSAGVFTPGPDGRVVAVLETGPDTSAFVITLEPPGGSKAPSGPMVGQVGA
ncbi:MAG: anti-sigma factor [Candidatus Nanopelagicales bacterium]|jgi:anti-sigma-K factor RskA|nr:anti-sigma factor [Candidatus Nanopelagicales bacterium]